MTRKLHYTIQAADHGKKIGVFLREKDYSRGVLIELKKTERGIQKNGVRASVNEVLKTGDCLSVCLEEDTHSEKIIPKECRFDILYEDEDLLVINKPYDMPVHPSINNYDNTLANGVMYYYGQQNRPYTFRCINRLDRDTTGITILAKNLLSASILAKQIEERTLSRTYIAFVEGITEESGIIDQPIGREEGSIIKRQIDGIDSQNAKTYYRRLQVLAREGEAVSIVALQLETGRTHQIRVHMSSIGHPLLGDFLYNEHNHMLTRQALHGVQCGFTHPITGVYMQITAPLPEDMAQLVTLSTGGAYRQAELEKQLKTIRW